ncbi:MAG: hypothetical protein IPL46_21650 [Saprospiraceae bacterium]|nr:hypothetical protein [Saprospiraceae bacterium]
MDLRAMTKISLLCVLVFYCCEKPENDKITLNIEFDISSIISFSDSLLVTFDVEVLNGIPPYYYEWESPGGLTGKGPFTLMLIDDFEFKLNVTDSKDNFVTKKFLFETTSYLSDSTYDYRNKYIGDYIFNVIAESYFASDDGSISYLFEGTIEKYLKNRLLIKYSQESVQCECKTSETSSCGGPIESDCAQNCFEDKLSFVKNWVSPIIYINDSLTLFEDYSMSRAFANGKFKSDTIAFKLSYVEKVYGYYHTIKGVKQE